MADQDYTGRRAALLRNGTIFDGHMRDNHRRISSANTHTFSPTSIKGYFFAFLIFLLCISLPWGCGNDVQGVLTAGESDTGSASLTIRWNDTQYSHNSKAMQISLNCEASGIEDVVCNVHDTSTGALLVAGGPWNCEAHSGTIKGIPVGQNRTFVVLAEDFNGNVKWQGEVTGVTIIAGKNNENVSVDAYPFIPLLIYPNNGDIVDPNAVSLEWEPCVNADAYIVQVAEDEDFYDIVIDQTTPGSTYAFATLTPSTKYYWKISAIDLYTNIGAESETRRFITSDCTYSISATDNTISSGGGTGEFHISTSSILCGWYAEENATWLTITSESNGVGDGTVSYTVLPNTGDSRTAVISIAGQTHTVNQDSALGSLKVTIYPAEAVSAGARWRVDGGDWNISGYTQNGLSAGSHLLAFNTIAGWIKPPSQTIIISTNQTIDTSGEYSQYTVIDLRVDAYKIKNNKYAYLTWTGANSTFVDVYRDGTIIATTANDGVYIHGPFSAGDPATYQLCEHETSICSNLVMVSW